MGGMERRAAAPSGRVSIVRDDILMSRRSAGRTARAAAASGGELMRRASLSRWALLGGLAISSPVLAQSAQTSSSLSIVDNQAVALASSHYSANGTVGVVYDSDAAGGTAAVAALRGLKQEDVIVSPTLTLEAFRPFGRESAFVTGTVGYNFYDRNSVLSRENINLNGGVNGQLGACRATATAGYARFQNQLVDTTLARVQDTFDQVSVGAEATCGRGFGFSPIVTVNQSWANNSLAQLQSSDYKTLSATAGVGYQAPTFGNLSFFGQYQSTDFTNRFLIINFIPIRDGFDIYGGGVRYVRQLGARIQGTVSMSYTSVKPFIGATKGFAGLTYGGDITFRASSRLNLHASFNRDIQPSNVFDSTYYLENMELVEGTYNIGSRLRFDLGYSDEQRSFRGAAISRTTDLTSDELQSYFATLTYTLRKVYFGLNATYSDRSANIAGFSYPDTRVGLTAATTF